MKLKHILCLVLAAIATGGVNATQPQADTLLYLAQHQEEAYIANLAPGGVNKRGEPMTTQGIVRHGRWIYTVAPSTCEEMVIHLHGFDSIPTKDGLIQQPKVTSTMKTIDCPKLALNR